MGAETSPGVRARRSDHALLSFDAAVAGSETSAEVQTTIKAAFEGLQLDVILTTGADAQLAHAATPAR